MVWLGRSLAVNRSLRSFERSIAHSVDRSIARPIDRSVAQSVARSVARSLGRSLARSLGCFLGLSPGHFLGLSIARSIGRSIACLGRRRSLPTNCSWRSNLELLGVRISHFELLARAIFISTLSKSRCVVRRNYDRSCLLFQRVMSTKRTVRDASYS